MKTSFLQIYQQVTTLNERIKVSGNEGLAQSCFRLSTYQHHLTNIKRVASLSNLINCYGFMKLYLGDLGKF